MFHTWVIITIFFEFSRYSHYVTFICFISTSNEISVGYTYNTENKKLMYINFI